MRNGKQEADNNYYTLSEQHASTPSHGVYIHKGRKEVKK